MGKAKSDLEIISNSRMDTSIPMTPEIDHALLMASKAMMRDVPSGTVKDSAGTERCVMCKHTVGTSGSYCKWCGQKLRETPDWTYNPYQE